MGQVAYQAAVLADTPYIYSPFLEGGGANYADRSGNANNGNWTPGGGPFGHSPYRVTGPYDGAYGRMLIGGEGYAAALVAGPAPGTDNVSIEVWVKLLVGAGGKAWFIGNNNIGGYALLVYPNTQTFQGLCGGVAFLAVGAATLTLRQWFHLVMVRDAGTWKYYVNGALDTPNAGVTAPNAPTATSGGGDGALEYIVTSPAAYNTVLSPARIAAHYAAMFVHEPAGPQQVAPV